MKVQTNITKKIKVEDGKRWITFTMNSDWKCIDCSSNLPYKKSHKDWEFYAKAIKRMLKQLDN
jgi:hypothetical protein